MTAPDKMWREPVPKSPMYPNGGSFYHETKPAKDGCEEYTRTASIPAPVVTVEAPALADCLRNPDVRALVEAMQYYEDQFCEGFCSDFPKGFTNEAVELDCSGCKARAALTTIETQAPDGPKGETE